MKLLKSSFRLVALTTVLVAAPIAFAQSAPPAGSTGICKDGTYTTSATKSGACRGHQGIKEWLAPATPSTPAAAGSSSSSAKPTATAPAQPSKPAPATAATPASAPSAPAAKSAAAAPTAASKPGPQASAAARPQAPGGGPGMVWLNSDSNVYHCPGSPYYGKTKQGSYMSEADAKAKGAHPDHNKPCAK